MSFLLHAVNVIQGDITVGCENLTKQKHSEWTKRSFFFVTAGGIYSNCQALNGQKYKVVQI